MKLIIFFTGLLLLVSSFALGQGSEIAVYKVTNYSVNGVNYDHLAISEDIALIFYNCTDSPNSQMCFCNKLRNANSQSYGGVSGIKRNHFDETNEVYERDEFQFTWSYFNTYDSARGQASVKLTQIYVGSTVKMVAEIIVLETNEHLEFVGYLEE